MRKPNLLIVDDDPDMTLILSEILKQLGHDVTTASSAEEAMRIIKRRAKPRKEF